MPFSPPIASAPGRAGDAAWQPDGASAGNRHRDGPRKSTTPIGIAADAVNALSTDPIGFLAPKLPAAFTNGAVPGFSAAAAGGFTCPIGSLPLEAFTSLSPPSFGLRTTVGGPGVTLGGLVTATGSVSMSLTTIQAVISAGLQAGPATLNYTGGTLAL